MIPRTPLFLVRLLLIAALLPTSVAAQHATPRALLERPRADEVLTCRPVPPPNRTLPQFVRSFEWTYSSVRLTPSMDTVDLRPHQRVTAVWDSAGRLLLFGAAHDATETDSLQALFALFASSTAPLVGQWIVADPSPRSEPMSPEDLTAAQDLAAFLWTRRCTFGSSASQRAP